MQQLKDHIHSYYAATANAAAAHPRLREAVECDVCVVGGGIAGCSSALHLAERGYRVVLLEERRIGWGLLDAAGHKRCRGMPVARTSSLSMLGPDAARVLWDVSVEGLSLMRSLIAQHRIDCDWIDGQLQAAIKPRHRDELLRLSTRLERDYAYRSLRWLERHELAALLETKRYIGGLYDANSGHLHPLNYTLGLAAAAQRQGVRIFEESRALRFETADALSVRTPEGEVRCRYLVLCGNTGLDGTAPELARKIISVATYIVATASLGAERARQLITNNMAVSDMNWVLDYFRRSADHRLAVRRTSELLRYRSSQYGERHAGANVARVPSARGREGRVQSGADTSTSRSIAPRTSAGLHRTSTSCRGFPATASHSQELPAN